MSCPAADSNKLHSSYIKANFINFTAAFTEIRFFLFIISSRRCAFGKSSIPSAPIFDTGKEKSSISEISIKSSFNFLHGIYVTVISSFFKMWSALSLVYYKLVST